MKRRPRNPAAPPGWGWLVVLGLGWFIVGILVAVLVSMAVPAP
jgi:hypothetical protein